MRIMKKRKISESYGVRWFSPAFLRREFDRWQAENGLRSETEALLRFYQETRRIKDGAVIQRQDMERYLSGEVAYPRPRAQYSICAVLNVDWINDLTEPLVIEERAGRPRKEAAK